MQSSQDAATRELAIVKKMAHLLKWDNVFALFLIAIIYAGISVTANSSPERVSGWLVVASAAIPFLYFASQGLFRLEENEDSALSPASVSDEWQRRARIARRAPFFAVPLIFALLVNAKIAHPVLSLVFTGLIVQCQLFLLLTAKVVQRRAERIRSLEGTV